MKNKIIGLLCACTPVFSFADIMYFANPAMLGGGVGIHKEVNEYLSVEGSVTLGLLNVLGSGKVILQTSSHDDIQGRFYVGGNALYIYPAFVHNHSEVYFLPCVGIGATFKLKNSASSLMLDLGSDGLLIGISKGIQHDE